MCSINYIGYDTCDCVTIYVCTIFQIEIHSTIVKALIVSITKQTKYAT